MPDFPFTFQSIHGLHAGEENIEVFHSNLKNSVLNLLHLLIGNLSILTQLLAKRINKCLFTDAIDRDAIQDAEENLQKMSLHSLAAAHGHRRTLRKLLTVQENGKVENSSRSESLSLREALAEVPGTTLQS